MKKLKNFQDRLRAIDMLTDLIIQSYKNYHRDLINDWELKIYDVTYSNGIKLILE